MAPLAHRVGDSGTSFEHDRLHPALQQMSRGGKPDRAAAQDRYGLRVGSGHAVLQFC
jgi:hypothetical protein